MSAKIPYTPRPKLEKPRWESVEDEIQRMGGNVSPGVRKALEMLYRPDLTKRIDDLIDATNERNEQLNRQMKAREEMDVRLAEIREGIDEVKKFTKDFSQQLARIEKTGEQIKRSMDWEWKYC
jgi:DNA repair exonuclease SbcCD ATPase subunit